MRKRRNIAASAGLLVTFALGMMLAVFVAGSASAAAPKKPKTKAPPPSLQSPTTTTTASPGDSFFVINATVNATSDHEILGSSAFPNFTSGAVDNYYSMAHAHLDNSPFAEGTASPADTGPVGQTAAAGNTQQPQYADARWPGEDSGTATYGNEGGPYATAAAGEYRATADASEATNGLSGPGLEGKQTLPVPLGFDGRLRQALADFRAKFPAIVPRPKKPSLPAITTPAGTVTVPKPGVTVPKPTVTAPTATVPTPIATVTTPTPHPTVGANPAPPVTVPATTLPAPPSRYLAARQTPLAADDSTPPDGETALSSSTSATLVQVAAKPKTAKPTQPATKSKTKSKATPKPAKLPKPEKAYAVVTSGESTLGRVSLAGGQIVIHGIHVTASITNDGTPSYKAAVSVASATIGGVPVTIDQDGVHVAGQGQGIPYQQASDALNGALKQAGIQLFLVGPEVKTCGQGSGGADGSGTSTTTTSSTTTSSQPGSSDQSGTTSSCDQGGAGGSTCDQSGSDTGGGTGPALPGTSTTSSSGRSSTTTTPGSSCGDTGGMCDQAGTATGTGTTTTTAAPSLGPQSTTTRSTTTTSSRQSSTGKGTTTTTSTTDTTGTSSSSCAGSGLPSTGGSCSATTGTSGGTSTTSNGASGMTPPPNPMDPTALGGSAQEMTVTATGVHLVFTQPVSPPGVPAQFVEHILGEVYVDSLAVPATDLPGLGLSSSSSSSSSAGLSSSCGGRIGGAASGSSSAGGSGSAAGALGAAGSSAASGGGYGSGSQSGSTGQSLPAAFAQALRKPLWLLLAYLVWQALVIGTGWSLWNWRRGDVP